MTEAIQTFSQKAAGPVTTIGGIVVGFDLLREAATQFDLTGFAAVIAVKIIEGLFAIWTGWKAYS